MEILEEYCWTEDNNLLRRFRVGNFYGESQIANLTRSNLVTPVEMWWQSYLMGARPVPLSTSLRQITFIDAFCGCGGLSLGTWEAIAGAGLQPVPLAAIDIDSEALQIYAKNLAPRRVILRNANSLIDFQVNGRGEEAKFAYEPMIIDRQLNQFVDKVDLFLAGPPCQGNSNLNNHTRREDPRNLLYLGAAAIGVALRAKGIIIENVPEVVKDRQGVVENTKSVLKNAGYQITTGILNAQELGCAQTRRRHFLIASQNPMAQLDEVAVRMKRPPVDVLWAIGDLADVVDETYFNSASIISREHKKNRFSIR